MQIPPTRTAVRTHYGNGWLEFLEGIDTQKLPWSTHFNYEYDIVLLRVWTFIKFIEFLQFGAFEVT